APRHEVTAKLDSGARTSSINARNIDAFERKGKPWVKFELVLRDKEDHLEAVAMERPVTRYVRIKEHDGNHDRRTVVELEFCFVGRWHRAQFSLIDRSEFNYPILLGRRFLAGTAVIDPGETFLTDPGCEASVAADAGL
ncbi:MAG: RimK/LysX family protein, partial [Gammaproteobacteria bacterium]|nr:RimK/LysX family protein [Gammaproteobacteria bacterium]